MTDLISHLFDIATNEEFSPEQRKDMMGIAMDEALGLQPLPEEPLDPQYTREFMAAYDEAKARIVKDSPAPTSLNIDAALGRHLTKETLPNGGIRFGLASHLPSD